MKKFLNLKKKKQNLIDLLIIFGIFPIKKESCRICSLNLFFKTWNDFNV